MRVADFLRLLPLFSFLFNLSSFLFPAAASFLLAGGLFRTFFFSYDLPKEPPLGFF